MKTLKEQNILILLDEIKKLHHQASLLPPEVCNSAETDQKRMILNQKATKKQAAKRILQRRNLFWECRVVRPKKGDVSSKTRAHAGN